VIAAATACTANGNCAGGSGELTLLTDTFDGSGAPDPNKWTIGVFSGTTEDTTINVSKSNNQLQIGPLPNATGNHYRGIYSAAYNITGGYVYVQLAQAAVGGAYSMLTVGFDANNYYRLWVSGTALQCEREIGGTKSPIASITYNSAVHQFLQIRHDSTTGEVVCEAAANNSGQPGSWSLVGRGAWDSTAVPLTSTKFELKAGTSTAVASAGSALFDNFRAARPQ
jgi:hypothetical protein